MTLTPAYGRDYKSAKAVKDDYNANKDFVVTDISSPDNGRYANKQQLTGQSVMVRYDRLRKVVKVQ